MLLSPTYTPYLPTKPDKENAPENGAEKWEIRFVKGEIFGKERYCLQAGNNHSQKR